MHTQRWCSSYFVIEIRQGEDEEKWNLPLKPSMRTDKYNGINGQFVNLWQRAEALVPLWG